MNMDDIFSQFGDIFEAVLVVSEEAVAEVFAKGSNLRTLEVANGVEKVKVKRKFKRQSPKTCSTCNGQGQDACYNTILGRMQSASTVQLVVVQVKY
jgi:hypothetical protein